MSLPDISPWSCFKPPFRCRMREKTGVGVGNFGVGVGNFGDGGGEGENKGLIEEKKSKFRADPRNLYFNFQQ